MGESPVVAPVADNTMGDSGAALEVSVSFGRFENDLLSWERWSAFPTNKYLEEVEKFSTPGSVAQKKAYFEAHYKRIAARKAEQEDEDKKRGNEARDPANSEDSAVEQEMDELRLNDQNSDTGIELEDHRHHTEYIPTIASEMSGTQADESKESLDIGDEKEGLVQPIEPVKDEACFEVGSDEMQRSEELVVVKEGAPSVEFQREVASADKEGKVRKGKPVKPQKATTGRKTKDATIPKKKPAASTPKSSLLSNPRLSRPALSKSAMSEPRVLSKKNYETAPLIGKKPTRSESRRAAPSLHMSLRLDHEKSQLAPRTTMRKSLIMEQMGDKDIVKRAFKAFRSSNLDELPSSSPSKPALTSQIHAKETSIKSHVGGNQKKIEGVKKMVKKSPQSNQPVPRKTPNSTRLPNAAGADKTKSASLSYGLRSQDKADKRREFSSEKTDVKAAVRPQLQAKAKKEAETKRVQRNLNTKAKAVSTTTAPKTSLDRVHS